VARATQTLWARGEPAAVLAHATPYMQAFGHVVLAWIWLDLGLAASRAHSEHQEGFAHGIRHACRYFFVYELPKIGPWLAPAEAGDDTLLDTQEQWL